MQIVRSFVALVGLGFGCLLAGCGGTVGSSNPSNPSPSPTPVTPNATDASGNWQFTFTPTTGPAIFPGMAGYLLDSYTDATAAKFASAEMTATAPETSCFPGKNSIFLIGSITGPALTIQSQSVNYQTLTVTGNFDTTFSKLTGNYSVQYGCGGNDAGTVSGFRIATVTGTYTGSVATQGLHLSLQQNSQGNGNGAFLFAGSGAFTGFSCFSSGSIIAGTSFISGSALQLSFATNDPNGSQLTIVGTVDPAADTISASGITVTGGNCAGSYGAASLVLAP